MTTSSIIPFEYDHNAPTKMCHKCGALKQGSEFRKGRNTCRDCEIEYRRLYIRLNGDKITKQRRVYEMAHRDEKAERDRLYRQAHRNEIAEYGRLYYQQHRDKIAEKDRLYRQAHPERDTEHRLRRRALKKQALPPEVTPAMLKQHLAEQLKRQKGRCYYCKNKFVKDDPQLKATVDHVVPLDRGGEHRPENLVWAHKKCNSAKRNKLPHEWPEGGRLL